MPQMSFELFVALRYLFSRRKQTFIYIISLMSILGVAIGVGALVVVLGVYNGLTTDMRDKILGANAHAIVMSYVPSAFEHDQDLTQRIRSVDGVIGATPFIYTEVMLSAGGGVKGVVLRGIDPASAPEVLSLLHQMRSGSPGSAKRGYAGHHHRRGAGPPPGLGRRQPGQPALPFRPEDRLRLFPAHPAF